MSLNAQATSRRRWTDGHPLKVIFSFLWSLLLPDNTSLQNLLNRHKLSVAVQFPSINYLVLWCKAKDPRLTQTVLSPKTILVPWKCAPQSPRFFPQDTLHGGHYGYNNPGTLIKWLRILETRVPVDFITSTRFSNELHWLDYITMTS